MRRVYLDYNASTPIAPEAVAAMQPYITEHFGNPSSHHWAGAPAKEAVEKARAQVAEIAGADPSEIVFTSGGTEANNHAITGVYFSKKGGHIITSAVEHPATLSPIKFLQTLGAEVTILPVDGTGRVNPDDVRRAITSRTILITIMHANNEVGTIEPVEEILKIARERGVLIHTDAAQSVGKISTKLRADLVSIAGHKVYAPKGVGALVVRKGVALEPFMRGAGHESGRRAGTENVIFDVALGAACRVAQSWIGMPGVKELRDAFGSMLQEAFGKRVSLNGHPMERLPNTLNVNFAGHAGAELLEKLDGVAASTGSACHAGSVELSPVLKAMGVKPQIGMGAVRFSLGRGTTREDIDHVMALLKKAL